MPATLGCGGWITASGKFGFGGNPAPRQYFRSIGGYFVMTTGL